MSQFDSFASRNSTQQGVAIVPNNKEIPDGLKNQICTIFDEFCNEVYDEDQLIKTEMTNFKERVSKKIVFQIQKVTKNSQLSSTNTTKKVFQPYYTELKSFLANCKDFDYLMSAYEFLCKILQDMVKIPSTYFELTSYSRSYEEICLKTIEEINYRFLENAVGYQYNMDCHQLIPVDSEDINGNATIPAFKSLSESKFSPALQELSLAYQNFRDKDNRSALNYANSAFESVMKIIYNNRGWKFSKNDGASKLIAIAFEKDLIPDFWENYTNSLRKLLESGVPTARNQLGAHGQGVNPKKISNHLVKFVFKYDSISNSFFNRI